MASTEINNYIEKRYGRWLEYTTYHCSRNGIKDEANDVLNEVLCSLLQKNEKFLNRLLDTKKNGYTELDFFVLRMIKLNVTSSTSPYQSKYKAIPADGNVDYTCLEIEDIMEDQTDKSKIVLDEIHQVREAFESLDLSPLAKRIFEFHFFQNENFCDWPGKETQNQLYEIYNGVLMLIKRKIKGEMIF